MVWLGAIGGLAFVLAATVVGLRLLLLARRTRGVPELTMGFGLLVMGGLGYPLTVLAFQATSWPDGVRTGLVIANEVFGITGMTAVAVFNWRVFRPDSAWARLSVGGVAALLTGLMIAQGVSPGWLALANGGEGPWTWAALPNAAALGWAGIESLRYHVLMSRRARLGLADPVVVDRFRLWTIGMFSAAVITVVSFALHRVGVNLNTSAEGGLLIGSLGLVAAGSTWLAFLPPGFYTRWVGARAQEA